MSAVVDRDTGGVDPAGNNVMTETSKPRTPSTPGPPRRRFGRGSPPTDLRVWDRRFEVKTASLGANNTFQFNHVRLDREYDYLFCLGICPRDIVFGMWRKGDVAENRAGRLVRMAEGQAVTYKVTKNLADMEPIETLPEVLRVTLTSAPRRGDIAPPGRRERWDG